MDYVNLYQYIASLIVKEQCNALTKFESEILKKWKNENDDNIKLYQHLISLDFSKNIERHQKINTSKALLKYNKRYNKNSYVGIKKWSISVIVTTAAAILISFLISKSSFDVFLPKISDTTEIAIGTHKAILISDDGKSIDLSTDNKELITLPDGSVVDNRDKVIDYKSNRTKIKGDEIAYNELIVPKGAEYMVKLEDGTNVWINSMSKLKYPVKFNSSTREVYLEGEAYFDVKEDLMRPFIVKTKIDMDIKVLGTSFNVRVYNDEPTAETVLEAGSVVVNYNNNSLVLAPNQIIQYNPNCNHVNVSTVDTGLYTSWRYGRFIFENEAIEQILHKLSRWYDFNVVFCNENAKKLTFTGNVEKYDDVKFLLSAMETAGGVKFITEQNIIYVY